MNRQRSVVQKRWRAVPVRERAYLYAMTNQLTGTEFVATGEWKCVASDDETFDLGSPRGFEVNCCKVYHRSREAAEKHCELLVRRTS